VTLTDTAKYSMTQSIDSWASCFVLLCTALRFLARSYASVGGLM